MTRNGLEFHIEILRKASDRMKEIKSLGLLQSHNLRKSRLGLFKELLKDIFIVCKIIHGGNANVESLIILCQETRNGCEFVNGCRKGLTDINKSLQIRRNLKSALHESNHSLQLFKTITEILKLLGRGSQTRNIREETFHVGLLDIIKNHLNQGTRIRNHKLRMCLLLVPAKKNSRKQKRNKNFQKLFHMTKRIISYYHYESPRPYL